MTTNTKKGIDDLQNLGFTNLESEIYIHLLGAGASSGYAIAQAISKPAANVYKAINTLENKAAILVDEGGTRLCQAVPAEELLNALQHVFEENKMHASKFLESININHENDKVFRLKKPEQVYEKCKSLLKQAKSFVVIDAFMPALEPLLSDIKAAKKRGVNIAIHRYEDSEFPEAEVFFNPLGTDIQRIWNGQWLNLTIDSENFIMAYFSDDLGKVEMAIWSNSPYISGVYHSALISELQMSELKFKINQTDDIKEIRKLMKAREKYFHQSFNFNSELRKTILLPEGD